MTPDKIYISPNIENRTWLIGKADIVDIEYIRKGALMEWAKEEIGNTSILRSETIETLQKVIDKLNSM